MGEECSELQCFRTSGLTDSTNMTMNFRTSLSVNLRLGISLSGFPGGISGKESTWQSTRRKRGEFDPLAGRSPGEGHGQTTPVLCNNSLAWRIPRTEGPGRLQSIESQSRT